MRKTMFMLLAAALLVVAGCKKDDKTTEGEKMTFNAGFDNGSAKTEINGLDMSWNKGDAVMINGKTFTADQSGRNTTLSGEKTYQEGGLYKAYFPASMYDNGTLTLPATQTYNGKNLSGVNPMYAQSESTSLTFSNLCALVKIQLNGSDKTVTEIRVNADQPLSGEFEIAEDGSNFKAVMKSQAGKPGVTLNCGTGVDLSENNIFYVALPEGDYTNLKFFVVTTDNMCTSIDIVSATLVANNIHDLVRTPEFHTIITPTSVDITTGCVACTYTVSGTVTVPNGSHACEFGLVYSETDETPTIEEGASMIIAHKMSDDPISGTKNFTADITELTEDVKYYVRAYAMCDVVAYSSESTVKTVTYGTPKPLPSDWVNGMNPHPFTVGKNKVVYFSQGNLQYIGSTGTWKFADHQFDFLGTTTGQDSAAEDVDRDLFGWGDVTGFNTSDDNLSYAVFSDWGTKIGTGWRTLTGTSRGEYYAIISERQNADKLHGLGRVGCIPGLIILPDDWDWENVNLSASAPTWTPSARYFSYNNFTYSDWARMEAEGAVFLPAAGQRDGIIVNDIGVRGSYWSPDKNVGDSFTANRMYFYDNCLIVCFTDRSLGFSVRLVSDIAPE